MAYHIPFSKAERHYEVCSRDAGASLIQVYASEQQAPGAVHRCPVCGQPYTSESLADLPRRPSAAPDERLVLCCAACGTYSVGALAAQSQQSSESPEG
ncbi:MAG TPA: hypothetical protein VH590_13310 [Ktedonobacterales bacterium]|jgi:hypothetical protein